MDSYSGKKRNFSFQMWVKNLGMAYWIMKAFESKNSQQLFWVESRYCCQMNSYKYMKPEIIFISVSSDGVHLQSFRYSIMKHLSEEQFSFSTD